MGKSSGDTVRKDPQSQVSDPQTGGLTELQRLTPRNKGSESYIMFHSLGVLYQEDEPPEILALKAVGVCIWET